MSEEDIASLTPETQRMRVAGSKWVLVSEQSMVLTIWSCKVCMIMIYRRLTYETSSMSTMRILTGSRQGLKQLKLVNAVAMYVALGFVAVEVTYFSACRPFWGYWSVPPIKGDFDTDEDFVTEWG